MTQIKLPPIKPGRFTTVVVNVDIPTTEETGSGICDDSDPSYTDCITPVSTMPDHSVNPRTTTTEVMTYFYSRVASSPMPTAFNNVSNLIGTGGSCSAFTVDLTGTIIGQSVSTSIHCELAETMRPLITPIMLIFYTIVGFRVFASA
jgi:hypothetical protein